MLPSDLFCSKRLFLVLTLPATHFELILNKNLDFLTALDNILQKQGRVLQSCIVSYSWKQNVKVIINSGCKFTSNFDQFHLFCRWAILVLLVRHISNFCFKIWLCSFWIWIQIWNWSFQNPSNLGLVFTLLKCLSDDDKKTSFITSTPEKRRKGFRRKSVGRTRCRRRRSPRRPGKRRRRLKGFKPFIVQLQ